MNIFTPQEIAENLGNIGANKGKLSFLKMVLLGIAAGAFIAFGGLAALTASSGWPDPWAASGLNKLILGAAFPVGLMLVVLTGAELFTGNNMFLAVSVLEKKSSVGELLKNWIVVYFANLIGALIIVAIVYFGNMLASGGELTAVGTKALAVGQTKTGLSFGSAFFRAIGCNWLVCLAVWLACGAKDVIGKIFSCFFPIMTFVLVGFEHSVANMFFIPAAMLVPGSEITFAALWGNLIPVTLGNIVGGAIFVGGLFWAAYLYPNRKKAE
ncbi:MAG: formate/nitrite transporter family protein [Firmicutes bacterium]|nr:formate/nitrite transporter family protein [Bacillota bacterium]